MAKNKKITIIVSAVLVFILSFTLFGYFQFFGPISVNLESETIDQIGFMHFSNEGDWQTIYVNESEKEPLLQELQDIKFRKTMGECRCMGEAKVFIEYRDESQVKFDGFYLEKTSSSGQVKYFPLRQFDEIVSQLYIDFIIE